MPRTNKKYTLEFKIKVIEAKIKENLSPYEAARRFNIIKRVLEENKGRYGYRRMTIALNKLPEYKNNLINHKKVLKLMRFLVLKCKTSNVSRYNSYKGQVGKIVNNLLINKVVDKENHQTYDERNVFTSRPNQIWCTDITKFKYGDIKLYLSPMKK